MAVNFLDSGDVIQAWMNSPLHRGNILNSEFTDIGFGLAAGKYQGREAVFVVQMFSRSVAEGSAPKDEAEREIALNEPEEKNLEEKAEPLVAGAEEKLNLTPPKTAPAFQKIIASPRRTTTNLFMIIGFIAALALILNIVIKIKIQQPDLILNGSLMLALIAAAVLLNHYLATRSAGIS